ncbi:MAG: hypothetical protein HN849_25320 [Victivallales bacterium]|jgi:hypothetical protein|nr:hypothetical protein [Victivallales bacterium]MBT7302877.1 hypothetical protein [Victivallales bacterium]
MNVITHRLAMLGVGLALMLSSGCTTRLGDMTLVSTRPVSLDGVDVSTLPHSERVTGKSSKPVFLFIPLGFPNLLDAIDEALGKGDGDLLVDVVIRAEGWWFLVGQNGLTVTGTVVRTRAK